MGSVRTAFIEHRFPEQFLQRPVDAAIREKQRRGTVRRLILPVGIKMLRIEGNLLSLPGNQEVLGVLLMRYGIERCRAHR